MDIEFLLGAIVIILVSGIIGIARIIDSTLTLLDLLLAHVEDIDISTSKKESTSPSVEEVTLPATSDATAASLNSKADTPIYLIFANNGEPYEDYSEWVVAAFLSKEKAEAHIITLNNEVQLDRARWGELHTLLMNKEASDEDAAEYERLYTKVRSYNENYLYNIFNIRESMILDA